MKYFLIIAIAILTFSCSDTKQEKNIKTKKELNKTAELVKNEFNIKGMTCEIGCAKLIESKLSKLDGVKQVKISFKDSIGKIEYDKNLISFTDIEKTVNSIADGTLYKVTKNREVKDFNKI